MLSSGRIGVTALILVTAVVVSVSGQQPVFRSGVDLIAVDALVVDEHGNPIERFNAGDFEVTVGGRKRKVVSVSFTRAEIAESTFPAAALPPIEDAAALSSAARTVVLAVDQSSFEAGSARAAMDAAREFIAAVPTNDFVGLFVFPNGPRVAPGDGRALVRQALATVVGSKMRFAGMYHLRPAEVVDITGVVGGANTGFAARVRASQLSPSQIDSNPVYGVQARECPDDPECGTRIINEAQAMALHLEGQAARTLQELEELLVSLADLPGRKAVVLVTGGLIVTDRPGGRPDVGDMSRVLAHRAAMANAVVYTVHVDASFMESYSASRRRVGDIERDRDRTINSDWLDRFSASAGGLRIHVPQGAGEFAFTRVLRETSSYYVLGVEPGPEDRDGRPRALAVKVNRRGATVRARQWVVVPRF